MQTNNACYKAQLPFAWLCAHAKCARMIIKIFNVVGAHFCKKYHLKRLLFLILSSSHTQHFWVPIVTGGSGDWTLPTSHAAATVSNQVQVWSACEGGVLVVLNVRCQGRVSDSSMRLEGALRASFGCKAAWSRLPLCTVLLFWQLYRANVATCVCMHVMPFS
jgi:hypothetical protein